MAGQAYPFDTIDRIARCRYGSKGTFLNRFVQYDADTHHASSSIRLNITHHPLSDVYFVYNDTRDTMAAQIVGRALVKFTNLFNF
jgi:hypothetical protein